MSTFLICATPVYGHVAPMLAIGEHLVSCGHRVLMLTGSRFAEGVTAAGMEFHPLTGRADFDDRDVDSYLPDRETYAAGIARAQYDIQSIFVKTIPDQFRSVSAIAPFVDAILVDAAFAGASPLAFGDRKRPPVIAFGVLPLSQSSQDVAPYGMGMLPAANAIGRLRNRALQFVANRILFRATQRLGRRMLLEVGGAPGKHMVMDLSATYDRLLQLTVEGFEYPRTDLAPNTRFIGPVIAAGSAVPRPAWWNDLDGSRPVVHVTQGTIDNHDFSRLVLPTIEALKDLDVLVVVTLGGAVVDLGPLPANVRVAAFLPYDQLLPLTDVFITNAGYGGVQHALAHGVPIIAAGMTEDKPEVCARVEWSGVGINLRTGTPTADQVADAVDRILADESFSTRAAAIADAIAASAPLPAIERELTELLT